jgi:uncharacterized protein
MLSRLGKWLRAAGHDTEIMTTPASDKEILALAISTNRFLITRDRYFLKMKNATPILVYLKNNAFDACLEELNQKMKIDWLYAPFSRCLICNSLLSKPLPDDLTEIDPEILRKKGEFWYCPSCRHVYWEGSHTNRMLHQLKKWQGGIFGQ